MGNRLEMHTRHMRLLSTERRTGPQNPPDVQSGRTQRESRWALVEHETEAANADFDAYRPPSIVSPPWTLLDVLGAIALLAAAFALVWWCVLIATGEVGPMLAGLL